MQAQTDMHQAVSEAVTNLKNHIDEKGIKYAWLTDKLGKERSWLSQLFSGRMELSPETKSEIESILGISL